jgi:hypothetical protein
MRLIPWAGFCDMDVDCSATQCKIGRLLAWWHVYNLDEMIVRFKDPPRVLRAVLLVLYGTASACVSRRDILTVPETC